MGKTNKEKLETIKEKLPTLSDDLNITWNKKEQISHQYLNDIGISSTECCIFNTADEQDDRMERFRKQRQQYGFDERETWSLDYTLAGWLYSHLKMYLETGGEIVDLEFHKFDIPVLEDIPCDGLVYLSGWNYPERIQREVIRKDVTQKECIEIVCEYLEIYLKNTDIDDVHERVIHERRQMECAQCALKIIAVIFHALWW